jgi:rod shape-determining protein MreD
MRSGDVYPRLWIFGTLLFAMGLRILPLPPAWALWNPDWVLLLLIYWSITLPDRVGVGTAWLTGLFVDALTARLLGQQALAYAVVVYLCVRFHRRFRLYPLGQQVVTVTFLLGFSLLLVLWTRNIRGEGMQGGYWWAATTGGLVWPLLWSGCERLRRSLDLG